MPASNPFGVLDFLAWDHDWNNHHYSIRDVKRAAELMREAGVGFVRMDFLWSDLEPQEGQFDFTKYEALVEILSGRGLGILGVLHYNPTWRQGPWNAAPDSAAYGRYARAVVKHFKGSVAHWEIWNEPDHPIYWQPQDNLVAYSRLLKSVYPLIKLGNPDAKVLLGGLSNAVPDHLNHIYSLAGRNSFDIVNIHAFVSPLSANPRMDLRHLYQELHRVMRHFGDSKKPVWVTETGCPGLRSPSSVRPWWQGPNPDEAQQASWVKTMYAEMLQWKGVEKIFWAFFRDTRNHFKDGTDGLGLVRHDFTPKPAYAAYQASARRFTSR